MGRLVGQGRQRCHQRLSRAGWWWSTVVPARNDTLPPVRWEGNSLDALSARLSWVASPLSGLWSPVVQGAVSFWMACEGGVGVAFEKLAEFLTVEEAAAVLRIGRTSAYQLCRQWLASEGRVGLPVVRFGRLLRVPRAALARLAEKPGDAA